MNYFYKLLVIVILQATLALPILAQNTDAREAALEEARKVLAMDGDAAKDYIATLNAEEAKNLLSTVLNVTENRNPDIRRAAYVIEHLETLRADAQAQERLQALLAVLIITAGLFTAFLIFVLLDQRRTLKSLQRLLSAQTNGGSDGPSVYRGE